MERFAGQTAVVTGAGGGMASAIVKELIKRNVNVVGLDKNIENLKILDEELAKDSQMYKGKFHFKECNISDVTQTQETFAWINQNFNSFAILVNGAGVTAGVADNDLQYIEEIDFDMIFDTNIKGLVFCTKEALNCMINKSIGGHIINICSIAGHDKYYCPFSIYAASKHAVRIFSDNLRRNILKKRANIKVTNISPGLVDTDMSRPFFKTFDLSRVEYLDPDDMARVCISILDTPPHVSISEIHVEPLFHVDLNMENPVTKLKSSQ